MKKKILKILLVSMTIAMFLTSCGGNSGSGSKSGSKSGSGKDENIVVIGALTDLVTLDPGHMYEPYANMISYAMYNMLYRVDSGTLGDPVPDVATSYEVDETGKVYTFKMRDDVVFSSGNKMTAKDVEWSVTRLLNMPESNAYANAKVVTEVKALDDYTVEFTLEEADASFLSKLTTNAFAILDSELVKENGGSDSGNDDAKKWLDSNSAGSSQFVLKEWVPKEQVVLEKNEKYWGEGSNVDQIIIREMENVDAQITALKSGEIDISLGLNGETAKQIKGVENIEITTGETALETFLVMSRDESLSKEMANPKVQQAVRYALDYENYLSLAGEGSKLPLNIVQQGFPGAIERKVDYRNLDKAKSLMKEAGLEDGFKVKLTVANNNSEGLEWTTIAQKVKEDLSEINIDVEIETLETTLVYEKMRDASMPFYIMFWSPDYFDINNQFAFLPGTGEDGSTYGNRSKWAIDDNNKELIDISNKIFVETDKGEREKLSKQFQEKFEEDNPFAFILQSPKTYAYRSDRLENVNYSDMCKIYLGDLKIK